MYFVGGTEILAGMNQIGLEASESSDPGDSSGHVTLDATDPTHSS